jgi:hypothetical protein
VLPGATVIDVGTTFVEGKLVGDVAYAELAEVAGAITPVPRGVGPVTNIALLRATPWQRPNAFARKSRRTKPTRPPCRSLKATALRVFDARTRNGGRIGHP